MVVATVITVLVLIVLAVGANHERERRREEAAAREAAGLSHAPEDDKLELPGQGSTAPYRDIGARLGGGGFGGGIN